MTDETSATQPQPNPALKALDVMVGTWDLVGRDFTTNDEIHLRMDGGRVLPLFTTSTSVTPIESSAASNTLAMMRRVDI